MMLNLNSFLLGSYLGDGCFVKKSENHNTHIIFKHSNEQFDYLAWKYELLKLYGLINPKSKGITKVNIKEGTCFPNYHDQYKFATKSLPELNYIKTLSEDDIINSFDEQAFIIWLLDDGNVYNGIIKIACGSKSDYLREGLLDKIKSFGFEAYQYNHPSKRVKDYIRIPAKEYEKVKDLVIMYIPKNLDIIRDKFSSNSFLIPIKYFEKDLEPLCYIGGKSSDWIDLRSAERVELKAGEYKLIRLGVGMILPKGYEAHVLPRSSTPSKFGIILANSMGVIDNSYSGDADEWKFPAVAIRDTVIEKNDRICQFRIMKSQPEIVFNEVDHLNEISRGGIGSTGKR